MNFKTALFGLSRVAILLPLSLYALLPAAGPPIGYGQWNAVAGVINDTACSNPGVTCTEIAVDDGFRYETVSIPEGSFNRLILTSPGQTGNESTLSFSSESYTAFQQIPANPTGGIPVDFFFPDPATGIFGLGSLVAIGIASKTSVKDATSNLNSIAQIQTGYARGETFGSPFHMSTAEGANAWSTHLFQSIDQGGVENLFNAYLYNDLTFFTAMTQPPFTTEAEGKERGRVLDIYQGVTDSVSGKISALDYRQRQGRLGYDWNFGGFCTGDPICNGDTPNGSNGSGAEPVNLNGTQVTWGKYEGVKSVWVGSTTGGGLSHVSVTVTEDNYVQGSPATPPKPAVLNRAVETRFGRSTPSTWQTAINSDLNWSLSDYGIVDPFASSAPRTLAPVLP